MLFYYNWVVSSGRFCFILLPGQWNRIKLFGITILIEVIIVQHPGNKNCQMIICPLIFKIHSNENFFFHFKESWMDNPRKVLLVVRFLGTTPTSSSIPTMLLSICQQICYNMEVRTTTRILPIQKKSLVSIEWLMSITLNSEFFSSLISEV